MQDMCKYEQDESWVRSTLIFRKWEETKENILVHKWLESEKAGYDIGWERACVDWMIKSGNRQESL